MSIIVTCADGHAEVEVPAEGYEHEDGTHRDSWRCPTCNATVQLRETARDALFQQIAQAGLSHIPIQTLNGALRMGAHRDPPSCR